MKVKIWLPGGNFRFDELSVIDMHGNDITLRLMGHDLLKNEKQYNCERINEHGCDYDCESEEVFERIKSIFSYYQKTIDRLNDMKERLGYEKATEIYKEAYQRACLSSQIYLEKFIWAINVNLDELIKAEQAA